MIPLYWNFLTYTKQKREASFTSWRGRNIIVLSSNTRTYRLHYGDRDLCLCLATFGCKGTAFF